MNKVPSKFEIGDIIEKFSASGPRARCIVLKREKTFMRSISDYTLYILYRHPLGSSGFYRRSVGETLILRSTELESRWELKK